MDLTVNNVYMLLLQSKDRVRADLLVPLFPTAPQRLNLNVLQHVKHINA